MVAKAGRSKDSAKELHSFTCIHSHSPALADTGAMFLKPERLGMFPFTHAYFLRSAKAVSVCFSYNCLCAFE